MYEDPDPVKAIHPNPHRKCLIELARDIHKRQLFPGRQFGLLRDSFAHYFDQSLKFENLVQKPYSCSSGESAITLSLSDWTSDVMINAGQEAYFGASLSKINVNLAKTFQQFDDLTWQVFYQYPERLSQTMHRAKRKIISDMEQYYETPAEKRSDATWFARSLEDELRNAGFNTHDMAVMMMTVYWS